VLALDINHTSPSVLLFFNNERYLFNAGEGIQRLFREHKIKISQINAYFITRITTETLGGLPGMALSVLPADAGGLLSKQVACAVKGPPGLSSYVAAFRNYINQENTVAVEEFDHATSTPVLQTDVVSITPILVRVGETNISSEGPPVAADGDGDGEGDGGPAAKRQRTEPSSTANEQDSPGRQRPAGLSHPDIAIYAIQLAGRPGKFMPEKAIELGVEPGPLFGQLQRGLSVTTKSGRVVSPGEVMEAAVPGPAVLLLDTPSLESLRAVAKDERVRRFVADATAGEGNDGKAAVASGGSPRVCVAIHLMPAELAVNGAEDLAAWRAQLGPSWRHVVVSSGAQQPSSIPRATVFQAKLHALSAACFPVFALGNAVAPPPVAEAELDPGSVIQAASAVRVNLMPLTRLGLEYGDVFKYDSSSKVLEDVRADPAYAPILAAAATAVPGDSAAAAADGGANGKKTEATGMAAADVADAAVEGAGVDTDKTAAEAVEATEVMEVEVPEARPALAADQPVPEPLTSGDRRMAELTFLGTASSQPSKYRNVSGCYVDLFEAGGLLVDCGEDAMGQMKRRFGVQEAERRLGEQLAAVWWRARRGAPPLLIIGPTSLFEILLRYSAVVPMQFLFCRNVSLWGGRVGARGMSVMPKAVAAAYEAAKERLGLAALAPFPVEHIKDAHGLVLEGRAGWRLVFSGDTRPCRQTVEAARGATLLVHEATFEESMEGEARAKRHSTTAEAVGVGEEAGVYRTVLTHFSTRYPTLPELDLSRHPRVAVAMDLMSINLADLPWLPRLVRPMGLLFKHLEAEKLAADDDDD
ncbi:hypothetical protein VOLCADRAFT_118548, partial [Volvox carteri f. nagariensis]